MAEQSAVFADGTGRLQGVWWADRTSASNDARQSESDTSAPTPVTPALPWTCVPLTTTGQRVPGGLVLHVSGELDLDSASTLEAAVTAHLGVSPFVLTLDLSRTTFIDCAGLGALLRISVQASHSPTLVLLGPVSPIVSRLIALTGDPFAPTRGYRRTVPSRLPVTDRRLPRER
ncbi:STAS domain-containing protein [Streptacidiphilus sp. P02-A3a]|uniref:STAS domain-containing protein n=1 Tax=Streptacidiphilus sp. P02-A3a TaxID=2704468 RepID=UPI0015F8E6DC|nr:STAS domain-containing protein [Streptacidiphilus sp. P02-A3a]QMU67257.1 STAS domain-containing protein [Streptacidiphilus sp. P02-A3a]